MAYGEEPLPGSACRLIFVRAISHTLFRDPVTHPLVRCEKSRLAHGNGSRPTVFCNDILLRGPRIFLPQRTAASYMPQLMISRLAPAVQKNFE